MKLIKDNLSTQKLENLEDFVTSEQSRNVRQVGSIFSRCTMLAR